MVAAVGVGLEMGRKFDRLHKGVGGQQREAQFEF
jgi:hypothetical protein